MIFKQFYLAGLGHASYFIGSESTGEALVLDCRRDVDLYFHEARSQGMSIRYAVDSHQHNDYISGINEICARTSAEILASAHATIGYKARELNDGDKITMGEVVLEVIHTPGHTPEHICLLVTDLSRGNEPALLLSGGFLLVGDLARPDLFEGIGNAATNARNLFHSLHDKIMRLPDHVEVYPTHVAGSLCGGNIGSRLSTTIGYERKLNLSIRDNDAETFIANAIKPERLPSVPPYWKHMRKLNQNGPPLLGLLQEPPALNVPEFDRLRKEGMLVLDSRSPEAFSAHIPGSLNAGAGSSFPTWAGTVLPFGEPYLLVIEHSDNLWEVCWHMLRIGYDLPRGWLAGGMLAWRASGMQIATMRQLTIWDLKDEIERQKDLFIVDVRQPREWAAGHINGAMHLPGAEAPNRLSEIPCNRPVAVICGSGYRSSAVASILKNRGYKDVYNIIGGMSAWKNARLKTVN